MRWTLAIALIIGCTERPDPFVFPEPTDAPALLGPGGPSVTYTADELYEPCGFLDAGPDDTVNVHNGVYPYRGYAWMPFARDIGTGGLSVFDVSDPCNNTRISTTIELSMRETHTVAFVHLEGTFGGDWMVATDVLGVQFWRVDDPTAPELAHRMELPGVTFLVGSYPRTVHSAAWQYPYLYVAGADNGLFVIDATDPTTPILLDQITFDPPLRAGFVYAMGNTLFVGGSEEREALSLDISAPAEPQPIPGSRFEIRDGSGTVHEAYAASVSGHYALFARTTDGSGLIAYDIRDPGSPTYAGDIATSGNGGYAFRQGNTAFIGESDIARIIDVSDFADMQVLGEAFIEGDLDTLMPFGNVAMLSADEEAPDGEATAVVPWRTEPDTEPPNVEWVSPSDGATGQAPTLRLGISFDEFIEPSTAFAGSIRLFDSEGNAVPGVASAQEGIANYTPTGPLPAGDYTAEVVADGIRDPSGNPVPETFSWSFTVRGL